MEMIILQYKVVFEPGYDGGYTVYVPSLPGCISEGDTIEEAISNIKEAIELYVEVLQIEGQPVPGEELR